MNWYLDVIKKYAVFSGRARRKEYWMFFLFNMLFAFAAGIIDRALGITFDGTWYGPFYTLYALALLIPSLAVAVRRLHDVNKSGWYLLINIIPIIGWIIVLIKLCTDSTPGENQYGANPKETPALIVNSAPR